MAEITITTEPVKLLVGRGGEAVYMVELKGRRSAARHAQITRIAGALLEGKVVKYATPSYTNFMNLVDSLRKVLGSVELDYDYKTQIIKAKPLPPCDEKSVSKYVQDRIDKGQRFIW